MSKALLGAAVVGTGSGVINHVRAMQAAGIEVRSLIGRDPDRTARRAALFHIEQATTDLAQVLRRDDVDIVAVATPPNVRVDVVCTAADAGKHVMCEKPFALNGAEAAEMLRVAQAAGVVHLLSTEFRFAQGQGLLRRTVRSGAIGTPTFAVFVLQMATLSDPHAVMPPWRDDVDKGGGWLNQQATHTIDQIRTTVGEIAAVSATVTKIAKRPSKADDTYTIEFETAEGVRGFAHSSCAVAGPHLATVRVVGTDGSAWLQGQEVWIDTGGGAAKLPPADDLALMEPAPAPAELVETAYDRVRSSGVNLAPFTQLYRAMRDEVLGHEVAADPPPATFVDGLANQLVVDATRQSASTPGWVAVLPSPS